MKARRKAWITAVFLAVAFIACSTPEPTPSSEPSVALTASPGATPTPAAAPSNIAEAARDGNLEAVERFLSEGVLADAFDRKTGRTALHFASEGGHHEVAELLFLRGAPIDSTGRDGVTPLDLARQNGHQEIVELITLRGEFSKALLQGDTAKVEEVLERLNIRS